MISKSSKVTLQKRFNESQSYLRKFRIKARTSELHKVREFINDFAKIIGCNEDKLYEIMLVVDEICTNIVEYSYINLQSDSIRKFIWIECEGNDTIMIVRIQDRGEPFNINEFNAPSINDSLMHPHKGGWGIPIVKALVDKIIVRQPDEETGKNLIELHFKL